MGPRTRIAALALGAIAVTAVIAVLATFALRIETTLDFTVHDSVSGKWVWEAVMKLQGRTIVGYYQSDAQSDAAPFVYRFTHLSAGKATLQIVAESYQSVSIPITLKRGANRLEKPVEMIGLGIADLKKFYVFESLEAGDIVAVLRPVNSAGSAVVNHPCMDLWIGCTVSVQMKNGAPAVEEGETGLARGRQLFRGQIPWTWDPAPEAQFRYKARIPAAKLADDSSAYRVIDYLIVVPKPFAISRAELETLLSRIFMMGDPHAVAAALDAEKGRLAYFVDTTWNLKARQE